MTHYDFVITQEGEIFDRERLNREYEEAKRINDYYMRGFLESMSMFTQELRDDSVFGPHYEIGRDVTAYSEALAEAKRARSLPVRRVDTPQFWAWYFQIYGRCHITQVVQ